MLKAAYRSRIVDWWIANKKIGVFPQKRKQKQKLELKQFLAENSSRDLVDNLLLRGNREDK